MDYIRLRTLNSYDDDQTAAFQEIDNEKIRLLKTSIDENQQKTKRFKNLPMV